MGIFFKRSPLETTLRTSLWKSRDKPYRFFCAQCRAERHVPFNPDPTSGHHVFRVVITTGIVTLALYPWLSWKGVVSIVPLWAAFEVFYRGRVRAQLACPECGFDPYLYMVDRRKAREAMEVFWRTRLEARGLPYPLPEDPIRKILKQGRQPNSEAS